MHAKACGRRGLLSVRKPRMVKHKSRHGMPRRAASRPSYKVRPGQMQQQAGRAAQGPAAAASGVENGLKKELSPTRPLHKYNNNVAEAIFGFRRPFHSAQAQAQHDERMQSATKRRLAAPEALFTHAVQFTDFTSAFEIIVSEPRATSCLYKKAGSYRAIEHALVHLRQRPR